MEVKDLIKIECLKKGLTLAEIARRLNIDRHNYYFFLRTNNKEVIKKTEQILELEEGYFFNEKNKDK